MLNVIVNAADLLENSRLVIDARLCLNYLLSNEAKVVWISTHSAAASIVIFRRRLVKQFLFC